MNCDTCKERQKQAEPIPFVAYESGMARMERSNKRLWIIVIILAVMLFGSNIAWTIYENQFADEVTTIQAEQDTQDGNNYAVVGDIVGASESNSNN